MTDADRKALIAELMKMGDRTTRYDYDIGDFWNAVDNAAEALAEADAEIARLREVLGETAQSLDILQLLVAATGASELAHCVEVDVRKLRAALAGGPT